jgi:hypothetical protein
MWAHAALHEACQRSLAPTTAVMMDNDADA